MPTEDTAGRLYLMVNSKSGHFQVNKKKQKSPRDIVTSLIRLPVADYATERSLLIVKQLLSHVDGDVDNIKVFCMPLLQYADVLHKITAILLQQIDTRHDFSPVLQKEHIKINLKLLHYILLNVVDVVDLIPNLLDTLATYLDLLLSIDGVRRKKSKSSIAKLLRDLIITMLRVLLQPECSSSGVRLLVTHIDAYEKLVIFTFSNSTYIGEDIQLLSHVAAETGRLELLKLLVAKLPTALSVQNDAGMTVIDIAKRYSHSAIVLYAQSMAVPFVPAAGVASGYQSVAPEVQIEVGQLSKEAGSIAAYKAVVEQDIDSFSVIVDTDPYSLITKCEHIGLLPLQTVLLLQQSKFIDFFYSNHEKLLPMFAVVDDDGNNLAHLAVSYGAIDFIEFFDVFAKDLFTQHNKLGETPFMLAVRVNACEIVKYLIADLNQHDLLGLIDKLEIIASLFPHTDYSEMRALLAQHNKEVSKLSRLKTHDACRDLSLGSNLLHDVLSVFGGVNAYIYGHFALYTDYDSNDIDIIIVDASGQLAATIDQLVEAIEQIIPKTVKVIRQLRYGQVNVDGYDQASGRDISLDISIVKDLSEKSLLFNLSGFRLIMSHNRGVYLSKYCYTHALLDDYNSNTLKLNSMDVDFTASENRLKQWVFVTKNLARAGAIDAILWFHYKMMTKELLYSQALLPENDFILRSWGCHASACFKLIIYRLIHLAQIQQLVGCFPHLCLPVLEQGFANLDAFNQKLQQNWANTGRIILCSLRKQRNGRLKDDLSMFSVIDQIDFVLQKPDHLIDAIKAECAYIKVLVKYVNGASARFALFKKEFCTGRVQRREAIAQYHAWRDDFLFSQCAPSSDGGISAKKMPRPSSPLRLNFLSQAATVVRVVQPSLQYSEVAARGTACPSSP